MQLEAFRINGDDRASTECCGRDFEVFGAIERTVLGRKESPSFRKGRFNAHSFGGPSISANLVTMPRTQNAQHSTVERRVASILRGLARYVNDCAVRQYARYLPYLHYKVVTSDIYAEQEDLGSTAQSGPITVTWELGCASWRRSSGAVWIDRTILDPYRVLMADVEEVAQAARWSSGRTDRHQRVFTDARRGYARVSDC